MFVNINSIFKGKLFAKTESKPLIKTLTPINDEKLQCTKALMVSLIKDVFSQVRDGKMILGFDTLRFHLLRKPFFTLCATTTFPKQQDNIIVLACSSVKVFTYFIKLSHFENISA